MALVSASTLKRSFDFIWADDPALDKEHPDFNYEAWQETGEAIRLPFKAGQSPTIFRCRKLPRKALLDLQRIMREAHNKEPAEAEHSLALVAMSAVECGLKSVENWDMPLKLEAGRLSDETMDLLFEISPGLIWELGSVIFRESMGLEASPKQ